MDIICFIFLFIFFQIAALAEYPYYMLRHLIRSAMQLTHVLMKK